MITGRQVRTARALVKVERSAQNARAKEIGEEKWCAAPVSEFVHRKAPPPAPVPGPKPPPPNSCCCAARVLATDALSARIFSPSDSPETIAALTRSDTATI